MKANGVNSFTLSNLVGFEIDLPLTQDNLASFIGASRESTNKNLRTFAQQQWIDVQHKQITVLNPAALQAQTAASCEEFHTFMAVLSPRLRKMVS